MRYKVIYPEFSELVDKFRCVVNGNEIISFDSDKKKVLRDCLRFSKKGFYTELWYLNSTGRDTLCNYWN